MTTKLTPGATLKVHRPGMTMRLWIKEGPQGIPGVPGVVQSVNGQSVADVVLDYDDVGAASAAQGALADSATQPGDLATVATTGDYDDLTDKPTLGTAAAKNVGTASTDVAAGDRGMPASGADGQVLTKQSGTNYDVAWETPVTGSGAPLAVVTRTASAASTYTITSATMTDVDATNLAITFTVPGSGNVMVYLSGIVEVGGSANHYWGLRLSTTNVVGTARTIIKEAAGGRFARVAIRLTGLTPAASVTYKWAWRNSSGGATAILYYGNSSSEFSGGDATGPLVMEAYAA